jgi:hypothetical protein
MIDEKEQRLVPRMLFVLSKKKQEQKKFIKKGD